MLPTRLINAFSRIEQCFIVTIFEFQLITFNVSMISYICSQRIHSMVSTSIIAAGEQCEHPLLMCKDNLLGHRCTARPCVDVLSLLHYFLTARHASTRQCIDCLCHTSWNNSTANGHFSRFSEQPSFMIPTNNKPRKAKWTWCGSNNTKNMEQMYGLKKHCYPL
jgi:hypothetical protein